MKKIKKSVSKKVVKKSTRKTASKFTTNKKNVMMKLEDIKPNFKNPRKGQYDRKDLDELKDSLESMGQMTPLKVDENGLLLGGHRRLQAMKELKWKTARVDIIVGLSDFNKSAIMISDNATQRQFNAWDSRQAISDIYWNEFCEEYKFKGTNDKGYSTFAKKIGISKTQIKLIIESMSKDNLDITRKLKSKKVGTEVVDTILRSPKKYRNQMVAKALSLIDKNDGHKRGSGLRDHLRIYKKSLQVEETGDSQHPSFYKTIHYKIESVSFMLTKKVIKLMPKSEVVKMIETIEKNIIPGYKELKKVK